MTAKYKISSDVLSRRLGAEIVLVHLQTNKIYSLNTTAARFWEMFAQNPDDELVLNRLMEEYDVDSASLREEIASFLLRLQDEGFITAD